ncbi:hypothetical protein [Domibacillus indicus]|uniref:hypothetical protein n=1 Tax=Domibacillus indicus TaxID=1437523 RepID=UPI000617A96C|nr:hypothetical protein [Domibacillus indicus]
MISASTWFDPYVMELLALPAAFIAGAVAAWFSNKTLAGPFTYMIFTILSYIWIWQYFYRGAWTEFSAVHLNTNEIYGIVLFFAAMTWLFSWVLLTGKQKAGRR